MASKESFLKLIQRLMEIFDGMFFESGDIQKVASYFWERLTIEQKVVWKNLAHRKNVEENRTGKRKKSGFWIFALGVMAGLLYGDEAMFEDMWDHFIEEEHQQWEMVKAEDEVEKFIKNQINKIL